MSYPFDATLKEILSLRPEDFAAAFGGLEDDVDSASRNPGAPGEGVPYRRLIRGRVKYS